jgi:hypothetical protein
MSVSVLILESSPLYESAVFKIFFYFDIFGKLPYIDNNTAYVLTSLHMLLICNLKRFEKIWDIIDSKIFKV